MKSCGKILTIALVLCLMALSCVPGAMAVKTEETVIQCGAETVIDGAGAAVDGNDIVITDGGRYVISGKLSGSVVVRARALEVELVLAGFHAENPDGAALNIKKAANCHIILADGTDNTLTSGTAFRETGNDTSGAALKSAADLTIDGEGTLAVTGYINNGIASENGLVLAAGSISVAAANDGLKGTSLFLSGAQVKVISRFGNGIDIDGAALFTAGSLDITCAEGAEGGIPETEGSVAGIKTMGTVTVNGADIHVQTPGDGIKCNDSVNISSGSISVIAGEDCIKTGDIDTSAVGDVMIEGGTVLLRAGLDGVDSSRNVTISEEAQVEIYTGQYRNNTAGEAAEAVETQEASEQEEQEGATETAGLEEDTTLSFKISKSYYDASHVFCALYTMEDGTALWEDMSFNKEGSQNNYYDLPCPAGASEVTIYRYTAEQAPHSTEEYSACTDALSLLDYTTYTVSTVSNGRMSGEWSDGTNSGGNMGGFTITMGGNPDKVSYSCKGIKADGYIYMTGGVLRVEAYDDAFHAGEYIYIADGELTVTAIDDGFHADGNLVIAGGTVDVLTAYEALEGNNIYIQGGSTTIYSLDDGTNAGIYLVMSGGSLDITMPYGDTDGLDANYAAWVTGGYLVVRSSAPGAVAGAVDTGWGGLTVNGGTMVSMGGQAEYPGRDSENNVVYLYNYTLDAGDYTLENDAGEELIRFSMEESYKGGYISSSLLVLDGTYSLVCDGETVVQWTQNTAAVTA